MFSKAIRSGFLAVSVLVALVALVIGCGGGGGSSGSNAPTAINVGYQSEGITSSTEPTLSPGDQVILSATSTVGGVTSAVTPYNFIVHGGANVGTVTSNGTLTAGTGIVAGTPYTVTASSSVGTITWDFIGAAALTQPVVVGIVESSVGQSGVAGATITALDSNGNTVGTATTAADGTFTISVTTAATQFEVGIANVNQSVNSFYPYFDYGATEYNVGSSACLPPLPALTSGNHHYALTNVISLQVHVYNTVSYPPAPPAVCFG
jgi:hypothetical protein